MRNLLLCWGSAFPGDPEPPFLWSVLRGSSPFVCDVQLKHSLPMRIEDHCEVPTGRDAGQTGRLVILLAHLKKHSPGPVAAQALRSVSHFALRPPSWKQAYRMTRINTETEVGRISYVNRVYPDEVSKVREPRRKSEYSELAPCRTSVEA